MRGSLPRRYARALIAIAGEEGEVASFGELLEGLTHRLQESEGVIEALANDSFHLTDRLVVMEGVAQKAGLPELLRKFFLLLVKKNRIDLLSDISREYRRYQDEIMGIVRVKVAMPQTPEPLLLRRIEKILGDRFRKKVMAEGEVRPDMIGGLILKIDQMIYDGSIRRELERLKETMLKG